MRNAAIHSGECVTRHRNRLNWTLLIAVTLLASAIAVPHAAIAEPQPGDRNAREIRSIYPTELGFAAPAGVAFIPGTDELITIGAPDGVEVGRITLTESALGKVPTSLQVPDPAAAAFDVVNDRLVLIDSAGGEFVALTGDAIRGKAPAGEARAGLVALGLGDIRGSAFDPETGALLALDATGRRVVRIEPGPSGPGLVDDLVAGDVSFVPLQGVPGSDLRGLALDPTSGNMFTANAAGDILYEVDAGGRRVASYDMSAANITFVAGATLAPSGDPTDDAAARSVYVVDRVADSGALQSTTLNATGSSDAESFAAPAAASDDSGQSRIVEVSLEPLVTFAASPASLVQTIATSAFNPPSPDPAGITYVSLRDRLLIADPRAQSSRRAIMLSRIQNIASPASS